MMQTDYGPEGPNIEKQKRRFNCVKRSIYTTSTILFIGCLAVVAGCVYMLVDWSFLDDIMDYDIPSASIWIMIMGASFTLLFVPITGCAGARKESKCLLLMNIGLLALVFMTLLSGALCAIVWKGEIGSWVSLKMEKSLKETYGINLDNKYNQLITQQWDKAQYMMKCCGIRDEGWGIFRQTRWFNEQPYISNGYGMDYGSIRPMVPESCCKLLNKNHFYNLNKCQRFSDGPPYNMKQTYREDAPPEYNNSINYKGCYEAARAWIEVMAGTLMGVGIGFSCIMIVDIFLSLGLLLLIRD